MTKPSANGKTQITIVLDETGSMAHVKDQTISGFNEFLQSQEDKSLGECRVTLVKFNSDRIKTEYTGQLVADCPNLDGGNYMPTSTTPLYDAVAQAIKDTEKAIGLTAKVLSKMAGHQMTAGPAVILMVMTDGLENASQQYTQKQVFDMITAKKKLGWAFVFLGSNQDSWASVENLGYARGSVANFAPGNISGAFAGVSQAMCAYRQSYNAVQYMAASPTEKFAACRTLADNFYQGETEIDAATAVKFQARRTSGSGDKNVSHTS